METSAAQLDLVKKHIQLMATTTTNKTYGRKTIPKIYQKIKGMSHIHKEMTIMKAENMVITSNSPECIHRRWYYNLKHPLVIKWCAEVGVDVTEC